jgi:hypothetical protein
MRFITNENASLELHVVGYQFPDIQEAEYDSNWLMIEGQVCHLRGDWTFRDPCLLTYEAVGLAEWLESVGDGTPCESYIVFLEPNLSFEIVGEEVERVLRVELVAESRPPLGFSRRDSVHGFSPQRTGFGERA